MIDRGTPDRCKATCDRCGQMTDYHVEQLFGGGMRGLGWRCEGGQHICPKCIVAEHKPQETSE